IPTAASDPKAIRNSRSSSAKEWVAVRLSTYRLPSTCRSVPMSGVHMALRTLWIRIDLPFKRSSAAALSERIATRSSTALRAIDCGTCFDAAAEPVFPLETRGTSSPVLSSSSRMETRSTFMIWNVKSTTLSSSLSSSCCFDSSLEISSSSDSFFSRRSSSVGAVTLRCDVPDARSTTIAGTPPECFTGSWRTIVPPPGLPPNSNGSDATTCGRGAGALTAFTRNATLPTVMTSFSAARASVTRAPFRNVPLEEPTSFTSTPASVRRSSACLPEMAAPLGLELVDDLHRAYLGLLRHRARRETGFEHIQRVVPVAQPPPHLAHEVLDVRVALDGEQVRHPHGPELRHAPDVVASQVDEHQVLGA